jgi:hypothetical protein
MSLVAALGAWLRDRREALADFVYGMTGYEFATHSTHLRADLDNLFMVAIVGDLIGIPVLPPYYALRLVPYVVPSLNAWKRRVLRERHPLENEEFDLIEM